MSSIEKRQLWNPPSSTRPSAYCTPFTLPSLGVISLASDSVLTLTSDVLFHPQCTARSDPNVSTAPDLKEPFYASTIPQSYVIAACTVIAWILVVMLLITPRTNFSGHSGVQPGFGNGRGMIGGATGGSANLIGVGSRPWLQKVAALTVAISMTIVTADTFQAAQQQYDSGFMNALALRDQVLGSLQIRVTRVISDVFLWLAQVQTLIRLFPRHKEKVLIKWIGFALIILDTTFSCLNSFLVNTPYRPRHFEQATSAVSYLFELALSLLYAAWVIFYALTKRRYAFYHPKMRSICIIALLSLVAILTPVVFFVTDVVKPNVAGWGDYFRWVGAAAASVVVWEWVERIEALERDEKKDGILGREIFDGDEMLDVMPSEEVGRNDGHHHRRNGGRDGHRRSRGNQSSAIEMGFVSNIARRFHARPSGKKRPNPFGRALLQTTITPAEAVIRSDKVALGSSTSPEEHQLQQHSVPRTAGLTPPPPVDSPISREDTTSAASTVYVVRYGTASIEPQPIREQIDRDKNDSPVQARSHNGAQETSATEAEAGEFTQPSKWLAVPSNPFKRKRASPPAEVQQALASPPTGQHRSIHRSAPKRPGLGTFGALAVSGSPRLPGRSSRRRRAEKDEDVVTVISAQPRGGRGPAWSPGDGLRSTPEASHDGILSEASRVNAAGSFDGVQTTVIPAPRRRSPLDPITSTMQVTPASDARDDGAGSPEHVRESEPG